MRLDIYGQFVVSVVTPSSGWSKGRPVAFIEERDQSRPAELLIANDLSEGDLERFSAFARTGRTIRRLDARPSVSAAPASVRGL